MYFPIYSDTDIQPVYTVFLSIVYYTIYTVFIVCILTYITMVLNGDVNDAKMCEAEPRVLVIDAKPRLSFSEKTSPSRDETLAK